MLDLAFGSGKSLRQINVFSQCLHKNLNLETCMHRTVKKCGQKIEFFQITDIYLQKKKKKILEM